MINLLYILFILSKIVLLQTVYLVVIPTSSVNLFLRVLYMYDNERNIVSLMAKTNFDVIKAAILYHVNRNDKMVPMMIWCKSTPYFIGDPYHQGAGTSVGRPCLHRNLIYD